VVGFIHALRDMDLYKVPGVAETLDWTRALISLSQLALDEGVVLDTLGVVLKNEEDVGRVRGAAVKELLNRATA
jgi:hypothetical protein